MDRVPWTEEDFEILLRAAGPGRPIRELLKGDERDLNLMRSIMHGFRNKIPTCTCSGSETGCEHSEWCDFFEEPTDYRRYRPDEEYQP